MLNEKVSRRRSSAVTPLLLLRRGALLLLLRLHLLHHRRAAARDLPHPDLERQSAVPGKAGGSRAIPEGKPLRHGETIFAAFLHPAHCLGKAGIDLLHGEGLRAVMALAAVENRAVVGGEDV